MGSGADKTSLEIWNMEMFFKWAKNLLKEKRRANLLFSYVATKQALLYDQFFQSLADNILYKTHE